MNRLVLLLIFLLLINGIAAAANQDGGKDFRTKHGVLMDSCNPTVRWLI